MWSEAVMSWGFETHLCISTPRWEIKPLELNVKLLFEPNFLLLFIVLNSNNNIYPDKEVYFNHLKQESLIQWIIQYTWKSKLNKYIIILQLSYSNQNADDQNIENQYSQKKNLIYK